MWACSDGHAATAAELLRLGADVNAQTNKGWAALTWAAYDGHIDAARVLLSAPGVDVNLATDNGRNALWWARASDHAAVVALLEAAGAH